MSQEILFKFDPQIKKKLFKVVHVSGRVKKVRFFPAFCSSELKEKFPYASEIKEVQNATSLP